MQMHNILKIFKNDMQKMFSNVVSSIIVLGLVVIPSIFAWFNLLACWDVFNNTGHLAVAVANDDEGYESDLMPLKINVGDQLVSALRANDQMGWTFVDKDEAVDGAASGKYYAAVVIPENFSKDMLRFYVDDSEHASITYYSNEKINAVAPKITTTGADTVSSKVNTVFAQTLSEIMISVAKAISRYADDMNVDGQVASLADHVNDMSDDIENVAKLMDVYSGTLGSAQELLDNSNALIKQAGDDIKTMTSNADSSLDRLSSIGEQVSSAESKLEQALSDTAQAYSSLRDMVASSDVMQLLPQSTRDRIESLANQAQSDIQSVRDNYNNELKPQLDRLSSDAKSLKGDASTALANLQTAEDSISSAVDSAHGILDSSMSQIRSSVDSLKTSAQTLHDLASQITSAIASGDSAMLQSLLSSNAETLAQALSSPVTIDRIAIFPSDNFGSAMAPLYTVIAMFIGSLLIMLVFKTSVSEEVRKTLKNPKPRQLLLGRFCSIACVSLAQTSLMGFGNLFFLQIQAVYPWLVMLMMWFTGLVFVFIIYVLILSFGSLGKAVVIILLVMQITGCGGSYPLEILPDFVQWVSPFLPATHAVDAMRAAMFGMYGADYWIQMGELALFLVPAILIAFALRKPFERFMNWYVASIESTKIIA